MDKCDTSYAEEFLKHPEREIKTLSEAASRFTGRTVTFQITDIPTDNTIASLDTNDIGKMVEVKGVVIMRGERIARPTVLAYVCPVCDTYILVEQTQQWRTGIDKCTSCDNRKGFLKDYTETSYENFQWIEIQETSSEVGNGKPPAKVKISLRKHRIDSCLPGENVTVIGIYKALESKPNTLDLDMKTYIDAITLINSTEDATITLNADDLEEVKQLMKLDDHLNNMRLSIAPSIYGLDTIKEALAYQQCEGQVRIINNSRRRGQFHVLLAGSPGNGKSELGDFMEKCHPKGRKAIGRGSSGVGLTAAVVKEGDTFVLKAGAMPLADNGFLFVDEIEKMSRQDSGAMHPGMEQQSIRIDKADISAELSTRCSILAACNPLDGVWNEYKSVKGNLSDGAKGLSLTLLDRFALVFIMKQNQEEKEEENVIDHIMNVNSEAESVDPPYDVETLRKIFAYARTIDVTVTKEVTKRLKEFYMVLYKASKLDDTLIITRRQPNDLLRLSEASARLHGRTETALVDAENAIRLVTESIKEYGLDTNTGKMNMNSAVFGASLNLGQMIKEFPAIITLLGKRKMDNQKQVNLKDLKDYTMTRFKIDDEKADKLVTTAVRDGLLYYPKPGVVAVFE